MLWLDLKIKGRMLFGNVRITTHVENTKEMWGLKGKLVGERMRIAHLGKPKPWLRGRIPSKESRLKASETRRKTGYVPLRKIRLFNEDQIRLIRQMALTIKPYHISLHFNTQVQTIQQILKGRTYRDVI